MEVEQFIKIEKLQVGFDLCANQIGLLLNASEKLIENNMFSMALPFSILAREELTKLGLIQDHISGNKQLPKSKWSKITGYGSHYEKLLSPIKRKTELAKNTTQEQWEKIMTISKKLGLDDINSTYKDITTVNPSVKTNLESLNIIKQDCWYLGFDWDQNDWILMTKRFTKNQLEAIARTHLTGLKFLYYHHIFLNYKMRSILFPNEQNLKEKTIEYEKKYKEMRIEMGSAKFSKTNIVAKSVLIDYEKRRSPRQNKKSNVPNGNTKNRVP